MPSTWPLSRRLELRTALRLGPLFVACHSRRMLVVAAESIQPRRYVLLLCYLALWSRTWPRWGAAWEIVRERHEV